jgi:predicted ATP-dependent serine protease
MTKKQQVIEFCKSNPNLTSKMAWEVFSSQNDQVKKSSFQFYRNQAIKSGEIERPSIVIETTGAIVDNPLNKELVVQTIDIDNIDMTKFSTWKTGTAFDKIASKREGVPTSSVYMITGESGAGKTTLSTNIADYLTEQDETLTAGFVSCEMDAIDWTEECLDNKRLAKLSTVFMLDYIDAPNYCEVLEEALRLWNFVILDSFEVVIDQLKELKGWTAKKCESWLISLLRKVALENGSTIIVIQQYTKGGTFVGSNKIKHLFTGMMIVKFDKDGGRYVQFTKNRRCGHMVNKRLYYTKNKENGRLEFDENKFATSQETEKIKETENERIEADNNIFDTEILERARKEQERKAQILENRTNILSALNSPTDVEPA